MKQTVRVTLSVPIVAKPKVGCAIWHETLGLVYITSGSMWVDSNHYHWRKVTAKGRLGIVEYCGYWGHDTFNVVGS
jgi:hypothetical protein